MPSRLSRILIGQACRPSARCETAHGLQARRKAGLSCRSRRTSAPGPGRAGDIGPGSAHRGNDVGSLEDGCVVDAVPGHCDHVTSGAKRLHQPKLLFELHAAEHIGVGKACRQCRVIQSVQLSTCHGSPTGGQPGLWRDGKGRGAMVARDHHDPDTCSTALGNGAAGHEQQEHRLQHHFPEKGPHAAPWRATRWGLGAPGADGP